MLTEPSKAYAKSAYTKRERSVPPTLRGGNLKETAKVLSKEISQSKFESYDDH